MTALTTTWPDVAYYGLVVIFSLGLVWILNRK